MRWLYDSFYSCREAENFLYVLFLLFVLDDVSGRPGVLPFQWGRVTVTDRYASLYITTCSPSTNPLSLSLLYHVWPLDLCLYLYKARVRKEKIHLEWWSSQIKVVLNGTDRHSSPFVVTNITLNFSMIWLDSIIEKIAREILYKTWSKPAVRKNIVQWFEIKFVNKWEKISFLKNVCEK
jgi:hypothetical protein